MKLVIANVKTLIKVPFQTNVPVAVIVQSEYLDSDLIFIPWYCEL